VLVSVRNALLTAALQRTASGNHSEVPVMGLDVLKSCPELRRVVLSASPRYQTRNVFVYVTQRVSLTNPVRDGGSPSTYIGVDPETAPTQALPQYNPPQLENPQPLLCRSETKPPPQTPSVSKHRAFSLKQKGPVPTAPTPGI